MSLAELRDDSAQRQPELTAAVVALAEVNSGSANPAGVNRCGERLADMSRTLSPDVVESLAVAPSVAVDDDGRRTALAVGRAVRIAKRPGARFQVLVFGHLDTVFPTDHPFQDVQQDGNTLRGPGVADCKGGLVIALEALRHLEQQPWREQVGWEFLAVPDEEIGSHGSKALLLEAATRNHLGLGVEPALPGGGVAGARKGSLTVHVISRGRAAHVGRAHHEGRSAIRAAARLLDELEMCNDRPGVTVNCGRVVGGGPLNVVPEQALISFNVRVKTPADQAWIERRFAELADQVAQRSEVDISVDWVAARPPKLRTPQLEQVLADATEAGAIVGDPITAEDTGGSCDGNDLAAAGLVNVDSLGIRGGGIHSDGEFADVTSIPTRAAIMLHLIERAHQRHRDADLDQDR